MNKLIFMHLGESKGNWSRLNLWWCRWQFYKSTSWVLIFTPRYHHLPFSYVTSSCSSSQMEGWNWRPRINEQESAQVNRRVSNTFTRAQCRVTRIESERWTRCPWVLSARTIKPGDCRRLIATFFIPSYTNGLSLLPSFSRSHWHWNLLANWSHSVSLCIENVLFAWLQLERRLFLLAGVNFTRLSNVRVRILHLRQAASATVSCNIVQCTYGWLVSR